jgi:AraC-like DNA-binding protein
VLRTILDTQSFGEWEQLISGQLGHHRSFLCGPTSDFYAHAESGQIGSLRLLRLRGTGRLELIREQTAHPVLWIPLVGCTQERINGQTWVARPGEMLIFQPGDHLWGRTEQSVDGLSVILPEGFNNHPGLQRCKKRPHRSNRPLVNHATTLFRAIGHQDPSRTIAAQSFLDAIEQDLDRDNHAISRPSLTQRKRETLVQEADEWIRAHLETPFGVEDLAYALGTPKRTLQAAFKQELNRSPLAHAKICRLVALRQDLLNTEQNQASIASLMQQSGLLACGATARSYQILFSELPHQTRAKA